MPNKAPQEADPTESTSEGERSESDSRGATTPEVSTEHTGTFTTGKNREK